MSYSDDDFVEVSGYQSSDSDWEKIEDYSSGFSSGEEAAPKKQVATSFPQELVQSYYRSPDNAHSQYPSSNLTLPFRVTYILSS